MQRQIYGLRKISCGFSVMCLGSSCLRPGEDVVVHGGVHSSAYTLTDVLAFFFNSLSKREGSKTTEMIKSEEKGGELFMGTGSTNNP